jgi:hypothetical protein
MDETPPDRFSNDHGSRAVCAPAAKAARLALTSVTRNGFRGADLVLRKRRQYRPMAYWLAWEEPRAVGDLVHVEKFFARNLGGLIRARTCAGPAREGKCRTPSMYADEKSDEVVVPRKRPNKGRQLPAEVVEGRASPKGTSRQAAVVRTLSRNTTSIRLAAVRRSAGGFKPPAADVRPEGGARCVSSARRDLCEGRGVILVPTATSKTGFVLASL